MVRCSAAVGFEHQSEPHGHRRLVHFRPEVPEQEVPDFAVHERPFYKEVHEIALEVALVLQRLDQLEEVEEQLVVGDRSQALDRKASHLQNRQSADLMHVNKQKNSTAASA